MNTATSSLQHDERGATSAEYALLISLIAAVIVTSVYALGISVKGLYADTCDEVAVAASGTAC